MLRHIPAVRFIVKDKHHHGFSDILIGIGHGIVGNEFAFMFLIKVFKRLFPLQVIFNFSQFAPLVIDINPEAPEKEIEVRIFSGIPVVGVIGVRVCIFIFNGVDLGLIKGCLLYTSRCV